MPADSQVRTQGDWRHREDPSPVFSSRHDSHTAGAPPDVQPSVDTGAVLAALLIC